MVCGLLQALEYQNTDGEQTIALADVESALRRSTATSTFHEQFHHPNKWPPDTKAAGVLPGELEIVSAAQYEQVGFLSSGSSSTQLFVLLAPGLLQFKSLKKERLRRYRSVQTSITEG